MFHTVGFLYNAVISDDIISLSFFKLLMYMFEGKKFELFMLKVTIIIVDEIDG